MQIPTHKVFPVIVAISCIGLSGCQLTRSDAGTALGAAAGSGIGYAAGGSGGAIVGGVVGAVVGKKVTEDYERRKFDKRYHDHRRYRDNRYHRHHDYRY